MRMTETPALPDKKYSIIYADHPWSYKDKGCNGNAAQHYPLMRDADICALPVKDIMSQYRIYLFVEMLVIF